jgi:hypothetical protein
MKFFTRPNPSLKFSDKESIFIRYNRNREAEDIERQKYSFIAIDILTSSMPSNVTLVESKIKDIVKTSFDVFEPESDANFYHLEKLLDYLILRDPNRCLDVICNTDSKEKVDNPPLIFKCLYYLSHPAVVSVVLLSIFRRNLPEDDEVELKKHRTRFLNLKKFGLIEKIVEIILCQDENGKNSLI